MNKKEAIERLDALEAEAKKLREIIDAPEVRGVGEGWLLKDGGGNKYFCREWVGPGFLCVAEVTRAGIRPVGSAGDALDGIAHDEKGRIKVVGYVNAEELKRRIRGKSADQAYDVWETASLDRLIDELKG